MNTKEAWKKKVKEARLDPSNLSYLKKLIDEVPEVALNEWEYFYLRGAVDVLEGKNINADAHKRTGVDLSVSDKTQNDESFVEVKGRGTKIKRKNVLVPIPENLHGELLKSGNVAQAACGLIKYGLEHLQAEELKLTVTAY